ncbi:hypothetical protein M409DRAFT_16105 [Zasmidium cellare ATCC 36951]|uniref:Xylanolytic transcriptional activator regulatory domain-containing protein n=1 Tax=Zasmidium cellare ATCC 36951 TaxID=1080233 RepID=A0A6A6D355_ZASCE|nr:uncharacterized protein M409DRAFT_16105 [Zasmidium cellare ATCC 36951]KAF2173834.1 hypothetical protein M409DRAFT_16105 [Zasmidium cellare ATCC 36951]
MAQESPSSNHETGSLTQGHSPHESRFIGSSSGIYFINTVRQAFEASAQQNGREHLPAAEETVGGEEDLASARNSPERTQGFELNINSEAAIELTTTSLLGSLPPYDTAQQLAVEYFSTWHPVLPFLSGPEFLEELEAVYGDPRTAKGPGKASVDRRRICYLIIIQCVLNVGASGTSASLSNDANILSRSNLLSLVAALATKHDILTVQTILAAQVYCVSIMALRTASSLGGLLSRLLYHAGLHRCPYRYPQLSNEDRDLRKRILWSSYALDRYICQALGIPVSLTDLEIDVCIPGRKEQHGSGSATSPPDVPAKSEPGAKPSPDTDISKEVILANFVEHERLVGRALEIFHASLHARNSDPRIVLFLRSDVDRWFNNLPEEPKLSPESTTAEEQIARFSPFFHVLYEQLVIAINRPSLSLPRSAPEFHHGLQVTIRAAKRTIIAMERQNTLFWPGYLASTWMSGLIISFACQVGLYNIVQGSQEIVRCLDLLKRMGSRWRSAQRCHAALATLLSDLQQTQRRSSTEAFGDDPETHTKRIRLEHGASDTTTTPNQSTANASHTNGSQATPITGEGFVDWDVNDFFQDISWNNLFDIGNMAQETDMQFWPS